MRLLKLLAYALFGYALYEFFRGMSESGGGGSQGGGQMNMSGGQGSFGGMGAGDLGRSRDVGGMGQMSGPGVGHEELTQETDGGSVRHQVGRGVIS
jgi:hypothetical protein